MAKFWYDIARDKGSDKISTTKVVGLTGSLLVFILFGVSMFIMWVKQEIDHILVGEMMGFVLTLLGFKNSFGIKRSSSVDKDGGQQKQIEVEHKTEKDDESVF